MTDKIEIIDDLIGVVDGLRLEIGGERMYDIVSFLYEEKNRYLVGNLNILPSVYNDCIFEIRYSLKYKEDELELPIPCSDDKNYFIRFDRSDDEVTKVGLYQGEDSFILIDHVLIDEKYNYPINEEIILNMVLVNKYELNK